jgi:glycosyltransferase involved in cell wall biosynthesis
MYNVAPYVERCVRSLEDQDIPRDDYEIICINDGSPDNCSEIIEGLRKEYSNLVLINQENHGVSMARNRGIDAARGEYLLFIDPDDYFKTNSLDSILINAGRQKAQVSFLGFTFLNADGSKRQEVFNENLGSQVYSGIDAYFLSRSEDPPDPDRMWAVLFRRDFLNEQGLRYLPGVPFLEDGELIARILCLAERCIFESHPFYFRTTRIGSATNSRLFHTEKASKGFLISACNLKTFQHRDDLNKRQRSFLNQPISKFAILALNSSLQKPFFPGYREIMERLRGCGLSRLDTEGVVVPYTYRAFLYNTLPVAFLFQAMILAWKAKLKSFLFRS